MFATNRHTCIFLHFSNYFLRWTNLYGLHPISDSLPEWCNNYSLSFASQICCYVCSTTSTIFLLFFSFNHHSRSHHQTNQINFNTGIFICTFGSIKNNNYTVITLVRNTNDWIPNNFHLFHMHLHSKRIFYKKTMKWDGFSWLILKSLNYATISMRYQKNTLNC